MYLYGIESYSPIPPIMKKMYWLNCTFMELKESWERHRSKTHEWLNCTFMELKADTTHVQHGGIVSGLIVPLWNWKLIWCSVRKLLTWGLIVPLWNWKKGPKGELPSPLRLNCTFMELKESKEQIETLTRYRLNCTFMELKVTSRKALPIALNGLIVPLWNWKYSFSAVTSRKALPA